MSPLREQMRADMVIRGLSSNTQEAYISAVVGLTRHYKQSPAALSQDQVQQYLLHLIEHRKLACSTTNQAVCAMRFLFHFTLKQPEATFDIPHRIVPAKLPEILSREEVDRILGTCRNLRHQVLLTIIYASGLRVAEACALKVTDIDSKRMMLRVRNGKGG